MVATVSLTSDRILSVDGTWLEVERPSESPTVAWAFRAWFTHAGNTTMLATAPVGTVSGSPLADATVVAEASHPHGRLLALSDRSNIEHPMTTLVLESSYHEIYTAVPGFDVPLDALVALLAPLDISDTPEGIVMRPTTPTMTAVEAHVGATYVPEVAAIDVYLTRTSRMSLPANRGMKVFGGEIWRDGDSLTLANASTLAQVEPLAAPSSPRFQRLVQNLKLTRRAA